MLIGIYIYSSLKRDNPTTDGCVLRIMMAMSQFLLFSILELEFLNFPNGITKSAFPNLHCDSGRLPVAFGIYLEPRFTV